MIILKWYISLVGDHHTISSRLTLPAFKCNKSSIMSLSIKINGSERWNDFKIKYFSKTHYLKSTIWNRLLEIICRHRLSYGFTRQSYNYTTTWKRESNSNSWISRKKMKILKFVFVENLITCRHTPDIPKAMTDEVSGIDRFELESINNIGLLPNKFLNLEIFWSVFGLKLILKFIKFLFQWFKKYFPVFHIFGVRRLWLQIFRILSHSIWYRIHSEESLDLQLEGIKENLPIPQFLCPEMTFIIIQDLMFSDIKNHKIFYQLKIHIFHNKIWLNNLLTYYSFSFR